MREGLVSTAFEWIILLSETVRGKPSTQRHFIHGAVGGDLLKIGLSALKNAGQALCCYADALCGAD